MIARRIRQDALKALEHAKMQITCSSHLKPRGKPGDIINLLSSKEREALKELRSDMIQKIQFEWELTDLEPTWLKEEKQKLIEAMHKHGHEI